MHHGYYGVAGKAGNNDYQAQVKLLEQILDWLGEISPTHILDVGCGIGGSSIYLAQHFRKNVKGITLSPVQVKRAQEKVLRLKLDDRIYFQVANAQDMPFANDTFDFVWSLECAEHIPQKQNFVKECFRVLKPGGKLLITTWCHRECPPALTKKEQRHLNLLYKVHCLPHITSISDFAKLTEQAGFSEVGTADWSTAVAPFWDAVITSALNPKNWWGVLQAGTPTIKALIGVYLMKKGYKINLIHYGLVKAKKL